MADVIIVYDSIRGNTERMAMLVKEGVEEEGISALAKPVAETNPEELVKADGIILGSMSRMGNVSSTMKKFLDETAYFHGSLNGKVGGVFSSSSHIGGGNETTNLSLLQAMLIHGMVIKGMVEEDHYGALSVEMVDEDGRSTVLYDGSSRRLGVEVAQLVKKLRR
jgi:NAD(P)H dehydrogenase (quinone)